MRPAHTRTRCSLLHVQRLLSQLPSSGVPQRRAGSLALAFPGQGAQRCGMGADLYATFSVARAVFDEVDEALKQRLSRIMFEGQLVSIAAKRSWER